MSEMGQEQVPLSGIENLRKALLQLLSSDPDVRQAISGLAHMDLPIPPAHVPLSAEHQLLEWIRQQPELNTSWLPVNEPEDRQQVRLIAVAAQWERVGQLWDCLANRCKSERRCASTEEISMLIHCLDLHNLIWAQQRASLMHVDVGSAFVALKHERGTLNGDTVNALWLPGLCNAGGVLQRKPLVAC